jgi:hypothetical protein
LTTILVLPLAPSFRTATRAAPVLLLNLFRIPLSCAGGSGRLAE